MTIENELPLGLYWKGKRTTVDRTVLPFQSLEVIETVNESRATRVYSGDRILKFSILQLKQIQSEQLFCK
jgi:hypothetical protein